MNKEDNKQNILTSSLSGRNASKAGKEGVVKVGILGAAGYTGGELIRLLINHPEVEIAFVHSTSNAGNFLWEVHGGLLGDTDLRFCDSFDLGAVDVLFLCSAHGKSREFWAANACPASLKVRVMML